MKFLNILPVILISGLIGYVTNVIAVKLLFRPIEPVKVIGNLSFQGLIPKRRGEIAHSIGVTVHNELLSEDDIIAQIVTEEDKERLKQYLTHKIKLIIVDKTYLLPSKIQDLILGAVEEKIDKESGHIFQEVKNVVEDQVKHRVDVEKLVEDKILSLDLLQLESMVVEIAGRELKHIEWLGLVMGLGIGIIQGLFVLYLG